MGYLEIYFWRKRSVPLALLFQMHSSGSVFNYFSSLKTVLENKKLTIQSAY